MQQRHPPRLRYFTPAEANVLLPRLVPRLLQAQDCARRHRELLERLRVEEGMNAETRAQVSRDADELRDQVREIVEDVAENGVEVKGLDPLLLDFPALREGQEVLLCWKEGEERVNWWHPIHTGFSGRMPVDEPFGGCWEWCN